MANIKLQIGDSANNGQNGRITIVDEDRLCYLVKSVYNGAVGIRTISKALVYEFVDYYTQHPNATANEARNALSGNSEIDKFEYGYAATLRIMALMILGLVDIIRH